MGDSHRTLTPAEEAEVVRLMAVFLDKRTDGQDVSEEELLGACSSTVVAADLEERLADCREFLGLRETLSEAELELGKVP